ncbi:MAG TPA: glycosyltransferase N-terminal domain-containing protein, partial [Stellaceae bacterium]|nr:glycosyltransferase N-terminal domain-containing protein [Stellaceae bacterium]
NGRMSERSFRGWQRLPKLAACLLASFDLCLAQDPVQAQRLAALGAPHVASVGDLKAAAPPLPVDKEALQRLRITVRGRPLWLAASTHAGEEDAAAEAHQILAPIRPDLLTIIAPRHPQRANEIVATLRARGLNVARRSRGETLCADTHIYLADTLGELGLFYRLTGIAFIGGSLRAHGGHNPLEAALLDCAILHGPDMSNCAAIAQALHDAGAARAVADARELGAAVAGLLDDPGQREARAAAAAAVAARHRAVLDAAMERLCPWLDPMAARVEPVSA